MAKIKLEPATAPFAEIEVALRAVDRMSAAERTRRNQLAVHALAYARSHLARAVEELQRAERMIAKATAASGGTRGSSSGEAPAAAGGAGDVPALRSHKGGGA